MQPSFNHQLIPFLDGHFCWWFPAKHHTKTLLHCNHRFQFVIPEPHLAIFTSDTIFHNCDVGISDDKTWELKLDHIAYLSMFSHHSCVFQFRISITLKSPTFHMFIMHMQSGRWVPIIDTAYIIRVYCPSSCHE